MTTTHHRQRDNAFAVPSSASQRVNPKLRDLAGGIVAKAAAARSRELLGLSCGCAIAPALTGVPVTRCG